MNPILEISTHLKRRHAVISIMLDRILHMRFEVLRRAEVPSSCPCFCCTLYAIPKALCVP